MNNIVNLILLILCVSDHFFALQHACTSPPWSSFGDLSSSGRASGRATDRPRLGQSRVAFVSMSPPPAFFRRSLAAIPIITLLLPPVFITLTDDWLSRHLLWRDINIIYANCTRRFFRLFLHIIFSFGLPNLLAQSSRLTVLQGCI